MNISPSTSPTAVNPPQDVVAGLESPSLQDLPATVHPALSTGQLLSETVTALSRDLAQAPGDKVADSQKRDLRLRQSAGLHALFRETLATPQRQRLDDRQRDILLDLKSSGLPDANADRVDVGPKASNDFFARLRDLIDLIKKGYLEVYSHIIEAYSGFFSAFNDRITAKMKDWIEGANEGKEIKLNVGALKAALQQLMDDYSAPPKSVLFPAPGEPGASQEEAKKWLKALNLPDSCLLEKKHGSFSVVMDTTPLSTMLGSLPADGSVTWDTARFQAWQTGFNAQEERMKNTLQSYTQKYSNANSYHDNFNKTLSSHLSQYADMLKAMLHF